MKPGPLIRRAEESDLAAIAEIHLKGWELAYTGFLSPEKLAEMQIARRLPLWRQWLADPKKLILAVGAGAEPIDGFLLGGPVKAHAITDGAGLEGFDCEIYSLHCREGVQGRGLGRALMATAARIWTAEGCRALMLWAYADNRYRGFYERLGGETLARGLDEGVPDLAYGWRDLDRLIQACEEGRSGAQQGSPQRRPT